MTTQRDVAAVIRAICGAGLGLRRITLDPFTGQMSADIENSAAAVIPPPAEIEEPNDFDRIMKKRKNLQHEKKT
jgi:hypothetical protein